MSYTQTISLPPTLPAACPSRVVSRLKPSFKSTLNTALNSLAVILLKNRENSKHEDLFINLCGWIFEILDTNFDDVTEEVAVSLVRSKVSRLAKEILINPITLTPYEDPVCVNGWTLEKKMLPFLVEFDGIVLSNPNQYPSHFFAKEMIEWKRALEEELRNLGFEGNSGNLTSSDVSLGEHLDLDESLRRQPVQRSEDVQLVYKILARKAIMLRNEKLTDNRYREMCLYYLKMTNQLQELVAQEITEAQRVRAVHRETLNRQDDLIRQTYERSISILQSQIEEQQRCHAAVDATNEQIKNLLGERLCRAITEISGLQGELLSLRSDNNNQLFDILTLRLQIQQQANDIHSLQRKAKKNKAILF